MSSKLISTTITFILALLFSNMQVQVAQSDCSTVPQAPIVTYQLYSDGIEFKVTPSSSGCAATSISYSYTYLNKATNSWEAWTKWAVGSSTGSGFSVKVKAEAGKSRVSFAASASNKWGSSVELGRENSSSNGVLFQSDDATPVASTIFKAVIASVNYIFEVSHPESAMCSNYISEYSNNCEIPMSYRVISDKSTNSFYGNGKVISEAGLKVGYFGTMTFMDRADSVWKSSTIYVSMPNSGKVTLAFSGSSSSDSYILASSKPISLVVKSAAVAAAEKAAAEKAAADKAAAAEREAQRIFDAKTLTITCTKGKLTKKVTGTAPSCPSGYTNPMAGFLTFQAYVKCKLYKKDALVGGASLLDGGRTLTLDSVKEYRYSLNMLLLTDLKCATQILKMPDFIDSKIGTTRAIDGMQNAQWGKISAFWNYHPDNGLNISFNTK